MSVRLSARRRRFHREDVETLGAKLELRRWELGLTRVEVASRLGCDAKTVMWWERNVRPPYVRAYPAIIEFLGYEPWPEASTLGEALLAERRRRGFEIRRAAVLIGVDERTWRHWERSEWKPMREATSKLSKLLGVPVAEHFPTDVR